MTDFLKRAITAIDQRDAQTVEFLRDEMRAEFIEGLLATWRQSLPWDAKDLYVALLMDQSDARIETVMQDALASPSVESRAYAVVYLDSSTHSFPSLLSAGGWVDPAKVDAAVASYRQRAGLVDTRPKCPACGAHTEPADLSCRFCHQSLRDDPHRDPGVFFSQGGHYELRTGTPASKTDPEFTQPASVLKAPGAAMKFKSLDGPFGPDRGFVVQLIRLEGGTETIVTSSTNPVNPNSNVLWKGWTIPKRADYEIRVFDARNNGMLGQARFRIV